MTNKSIESSCESMSKTKFGLDIQCTQAKGHKNDHGNGAYRWSNEQ